MSEWESGNVYQDFQKLEYTILLNKAEDNLYHTERLEMMKGMARQRYRVKDFIRRHCLGPAIFSLILAILFKSRFFCQLSSLIRHASGLHFWVLVFGAPVFLNFSMKRTRCPEVSCWSEARKSGSGTPILKRPRFLLSMEEKFDEPCSLSSPQRNHVLCLTEQWLSAVIGASLLRTKWVPASLKVPCHCLTRLAALASLHQFQKEWFQLTRETQPRPVTKWTWILTGLTQCMYTQWFVAVDLAEFVASCQTISWMVILSGYTTLISSFLALASRQHPTANPGAKNRAAKWKKLLPKAGLISLLGWLSFSSVRLISELWRLTQTCSGQKLGGMYLFNRPWPLLFLSWAAVVGAFIGPVVHLVAFLRLVRIVYTHDLSLALDSKEFVEAMDTSTQRNQWRFLIRWRPTTTMNTVIRDLWGGLLYWLFLSGTANELEEQTAAATQNQEYRRDPDHIIQRLEWESSLYHENPEIKDRNQWKQKAMYAMAKIHDINYKANNMDDPLGMAIHQTFGIGLGFRYDHMIDIAPGEVPTPRRLQARAAKSARRRAVQIHDPATIQRALESITDPKQRNAKKAEIKKANEAEMCLMAEKLTELVPTDGSLEEPLDKYSMKNEFFGRFDKNANEVPELYARLLKRKIFSPSVERLCREIDQEDDLIDYLNPGGGPGLPLDNSTLAVLMFHERTGEEDANYPSSSPSNDNNSTRTRNRLVYA